MGSRIIWDVARVHAEVEAVESHKEGHLDMVNGRSMAALLVGNDVLARPSFEAFPTRRNGGRPEAREEEGARGVVSQV